MFIRQKVLGKRLHSEVTDTSDFKSLRESLEANMSEHRERALKLHKVMDKLITAKVN